MKVYDRVKQLLQDSEACRNSDKVLLLELWQLDGLYLTPQKREIFMNDCTVAESATRARRDMRAEYPGNKTVEQGRFDLFEQYRMEYKR